jgi:hypothetical protein
VQLLVSWAIVAISTLYRRGTDDCADGEDCESEETSWWIVSGSSAINALGETVFILTVAASFLISFDSYINAKARKPTLYAILVINPDGGMLAFARAPCATELPLTPFIVAAGALASAAVVRGRTGINNVGVSHARFAVWSQ